jgi:hypothetical protein
MGYQYKKGEVVVGSTKGSARVEPRCYKGDSCVQVWLDSRKIAMLSTWLDSRGIMTRFMSDVIRESLDQLCTHLVNSSNGIELDTSAARDLIESKYKVNLNPNGRGKKNLINNLVLDDRKIDNSKPVNISNLDSFGDEGPPIDHPLRAEWRRQVLNANFDNKPQQFEQAKIDGERKRKELEEKYAYLNKDNVAPNTEPTECKPEFDPEDKTMKPANKEILERLRNAKSAEEKKAIIYAIKAEHEESIKRQRIEEEVREKLDKKRAKALRKAGIEVDPISSVPRHKTDEELKLDDLARQKRERDQMAILDRGIPPARTSKDAL